MPSKSLGRAQPSGRRTSSVSRGRAAEEPGGSFEESTEKADLKAPHRVEHQPDCRTTRRWRRARHENVKINSSLLPYTSREKIDSAHVQFLRRAAKTRVLPLGSDLKPSSGEPPQNHPLKSDLLKTTGRPPERSNNPKIPARLHCLQRLSL